MVLSLDQVKKMIPANREAELWHSYANEFLDKYEINTTNRIAGFFAQAAHESGDFNTLVENLNYSWQRLREVFPRYFPSDSMAQQYHRNSQMIANRVYNDALRTNKLGNVNEGDGYRFRGRGLFQLTGRWNYTEFGKSIGMSAEEAAAYCSTKRGAFESACWYWKRNNLNSYADRDDITGMSKAVNGGTIGLSDRISKYNRNKSVLKTSSTTTPVVTEQRMIMKGSRGDDVKAVQQKLGLTADGIFGSITEQAVRSWQRSKGYTVTGKLTGEQVKEIISV